MQDLASYDKPEGDSGETMTWGIRGYISRVENGHTVPAIETLEKLTRTLEVPMYSYFMTAKSHPNQMPRCRSRVMKRFRSRCQDTSELSQVDEPDR